MAVAITGLLLTGCGSSLADRDPSATPRYGGPLDGSAAVAALECDGETPFWSGEYAYDDGLGTVQDSAEAALDSRARARRQGAALV